MNKHTIKLIYTAIILAISLKINAQDAVFSQFYSSALYLNPALAGAEQHLSVSTNYRSQWGSVLGGSSAFNTFQTSFIKPIHKGEVVERHIGGLGASVFSSAAGDGRLRTSGVNLNGAYNIQLSKNHSQFLSMGLQIGLVQKQVNFSDLQWASQYNSFIADYDPTLPADASGVSDQKMYPDISAGLMYYYNAEKDYESKKASFYLGLAGYHLNMPNESLITGSVAKLPMTLRGHTGLEFAISKRIHLSPNALVVMQDKFMQINTGAYFTFLFSEGESKIAPAYFILGGWYRLEDSMIASIGFGNNYYNFGFSYDLNNSNLRYSTKNSSAYEISLKIQKPRIEKIRRFYTPRL
jgi:type IX secretion system PorP/SprF family membrane protein